MIAVEPSEQMRARGVRLHGTDKIRWINDRLPGLENVHRPGISFDFILLNAVWMHVLPANRRRAFRKLVTLLKRRPSRALSLPSCPQCGSPLPAHRWNNPLHLHPPKIDFSSSVATSSNRATIGTAANSRPILRLPAQDFSAMYNAAFSFEVFPSWEGAWVNKAREILSLVATVE